MLSDLNMLIEDCPAFLLLGEIVDCPAFLNKITAGLHNDTKSCINCGCKAKRVEFKFHLKSAYSLPFCDNCRIDEMAPLPNEYLTFWAFLQYVRFRSIRWARVVGNICVCGKLAGTAIFPGTFMQRYVNYVDAETGVGVTRMTDGIMHEDVCVACFAKMMQHVTHGQVYSPVGKHEFMYTITKERRADMSLLAHHGLKQFMILSEYLILDISAKIVAIYLGMRGL